MQRIVQKALSQSVHNSNLSSSKLCVLTVALMALIACSENKVDFKPISVKQKFAQDIRYNNKVDILFVIDNSMSMTNYQQTLAQDVQGVLENLVSKKLDVQMGFVTTDMNAKGSGGKLLGSPNVLSLSTPDLANQVQSRLMVSNRSSPVEQGIDSIKAVLNPNYLATKAPGFIRSGAMFSIIVLSDKNDYSQTTTAQLEQFLDGMKGQLSTGERAWTINYMGVLNSASRCKAWDGFIDVGSKYLDLVRYSGGVSYSICEDNLVETVLNIEPKLLQVLTRYHLDRKPEIDSIVVAVNGVTILHDNQNGWSYDSASNDIVFNGSSIPQTDASISVDFNPAESN